MPESGSLHLICIVEGRAEILDEIDRHLRADDLIAVESSRDVQFALLGLAKLLILEI